MRRGQGLGVGCWGGRGLDRGEGFVAGGVSRGGPGTSPAVTCSPNLPIICLARLFYCEFFGGICETGIIDAWLWHRQSEKSAKKGAALTM